MSAVIKSKTPRRRLNLTVRGDYVKQAREFGLNVSQVLEEALEQRLKQEREQRWLEENREALEAHARRIERDGLWHKGLTKLY
ncbi:MAG TPA: type II toxin-antitoxin system CcdA family antitoxin [Nevskiaceae bacterium]|nr:type II toxin-antitoxin system CcdA family antitoxin [Nevskiaceae bacterium]